MTVNEQQSKVIEEIQRMVARLLATNPAGHGLCLIGGFRYRFLDHSARQSRDLDYHWEGDLAAKQAELVSVLRRRLLPEAKRRLAYEGDVRSATGPEGDSPSVRIVELAFWPSSGPGGRVEVPVDITRIVCLDPLTVRTADGVVYPTPSNADLIESKVIALFNRHHMEHRDLVDLFLFSSHLRPDSAERLRDKFVRLSIVQETIRRQLRDWESYPDYHIRSVAAIITDQLDPSAAASIQGAGGAKLVFETVRQLLVSTLKLGEERTDESA
jgi:hypothetical protein